MMKKLTAWIVAAMLAIGLSACGDGPNDSSGGGGSDSGSSGDSGGSGYN
jgi:hypothetical protein